MDIVEDKIETEAPPKEKRKRKKKIINAIQEQLEFYFGDVNLRHDRFLRKEIENTKDGYIDMSLMLKFNKLKEISTDFKLMAKAVRNSKELQLNEDETKLKRIKGLPELKNTDNQTIYVDQLIAYCNHDYLKQVFSCCGTIDYISLPRYQNNGKIKGFAFIEFSKPEEAEKACQMFSTVTARKNKSKKRHSSSDIKTVDVKKEKRKRKRSVSCSETDTPTCDDKKSKRKRSSSNSENTLSKEEENSSNIDINKRNIECESTSDIPKDTFSEKNKDKLISNSTNDANKTIENDISLKGKIKKNKKSDSELSDESVSKKRPKLEINYSTEEDFVESQHGTDTSISNKKAEKKKKRKQKHRKRKESETKEITLPPLYVIPKSEWLSLKKQYKNLQLKDMRQLKRTTRIIKSERVKRKELKLSKESNTTSETGMTKDNKIKGDETNSEENKTGNTELESAEQKVATKKKEYKQLDMKPGTVMFVKANCQNLNKQSIKDSLSKLVQISYVDYINGDDKGYIRFESSQMVDKISKESLKDLNFSLEKLSEQEENEYFEKALTDQKKRYELNEKRKKKKERGCSKIMRKVESAQSHVRFD